MKLAINIGNTHVWCAYEKERNISSHHFAHAEVEQKLNQLLSEEVFITVGVASVVPELTENIIAILKQHNISEIKEIHRPSVLSQINDGGWDGIGIDRLLLVAGLSENHQPSLVCDFGTAITINRIRNKSLESGFILPGFEMSTQALHSHTALLPHVDFKEECVLHPRTTSDNIRSGIILSAVYFIESLAEKENYQIVLTGGYARHILQYFSAPVTYDTHLLIKGMLQVI